MNNKDHLRKKRFAEYNQTDFSTKNRAYLLRSKHEIENFLLQISAEEELELAIKKPMHSKRIKNWNSLLIQIEDQMAVLDYQEYLRIYNDLNYESSYFKGFDRLIEKYKKIINESSLEELVDFIHIQTKREIKVIETDFV